MMIEKKIAIVTPLRNEEKNINRLFDAVSKQTIKIFSWIILENGSKNKIGKFPTEFDIYLSNKYNKNENTVPHNLYSCKVE